MPKPVAVWNSARDVWETPQTEGFFCEHLDVFLGTFPTSGMTVNGAAYELPTWEPATDGSASSSLLRTPCAAEAEGGPRNPNRPGATMRLSDQIREQLPPRLLKTPTSQLAVNGGSQHPDKRREGGHGPTLADEVEHLLPTPQAHDAQKGKTPEQVAAMRARGHGVANLNETVENRLLPTPTVGMMLGGSQTRSGDRSGEMLLPGVAKQIGESTPQPSDDGSALLDGQLRGQLNLLDAITDTD